MKRMAQLFLLAFFVMVAGNESAKERALHRAVPSGGMTRVQVYSAS